MTRYGKTENETIFREQTPEQAARAISDALDFLRIEANALGMFDVSELIGRARSKADEVVEQVRM